MGFEWDKDASRAPESSAPNYRDSNRWVKATVPVTGSEFHASGASPQIVGPLENNKLYSIICFERAHFLATTGSNVSASRSHMAWEAGIPYYHIARSGSSEYISGYADDNGTIEFWVCKVEF